MSQITKIQEAAGLQIFNECMTIKEFTDKFNRTFDTKHDEMDFHVIFNEWELAGAISRVNNATVAGNQLYIPISDNFDKIMTGILCRAIRVEQTHNQAYWAGH